MKSVYNYIGQLKNENGELLKSDVEKASALGKYFASIHAKTAQEQKQIHFSPIPLASTTRNYCSDYCIHPEQVFSVLKTLKPSTSLSMKAYRKLFTGIVLKPYIARLL